ncbi:MAG: ribonuclease J [Clostridia bacterium]|nr:ribonuclease J [Clostridia bacterium]
MKNKNQRERRVTKDRGEKLKIFPLGGLAEIGKNMTVFEYGDDIVVIDAGMGFPDDDMLGVDLVIPDITYLKNNAHKVRAILITHGHEDHIGAIPYVLKEINVPIYGTRLSLGIIEGKLDEDPPPEYPELYTVEAGDVINLGVFKAEFIHVNHSIADACAIALKTPVGTVYHSGDFKIDVSPLDGNMMDLTRIGTLGKDGISLLLCESTNAERPGFTLSERTVGSSLERIFDKYDDRRLIVATFSSNIHRVQQIIDTSAKHGRKVAVLGRSMVNVIGAAAELGYMDIHDGVLIDVSEIKKYPPEKITLITTGSQGEPMSALYRLAFDGHDKVKITSRDVVVLSSSAIPGNEKFIGRIVNALIRSGVKVVNDSVEDVHVSGHACREEIKLLISLLKPKFYMPIHGEYRHLYANKEIAEFMGIPSERIFISEVGKVLELDRKSAKFAGTVQAGNVMVDGSGIGDIGSVVLRDRKHLAEDGLVVAVVTVDLHDRIILSGVDIVSRGFVYVKESEKLMAEARAVATRSVENALAKRVNDFTQIRNAIRDDLAKFIYKETKRKPMILPVIMDV